MRKLAYLSVLFVALQLLFACDCFAQMPVPAGPARAFPRWEFSAGLTHARLAPNSSTQIVTADGDDFPVEPCTADGRSILGSQLQRIYCDRRDFHGLTLSTTYDLRRYVGLRLDFDALANKDATRDTFGSGANLHIDTNRYTERTYLLLAGFQIRDNEAKVRWRLYGVAMAGVARQNQKDVQTSTAPSNNFTLNDRVTSLALKVGGGIEVSVTPRISLRLIEVDYVPVFARERRVPGGVDFDVHLKGRTANDVLFGFGVIWH